MRLGQKHNEENITKINYLLSIISKAGWYGVAILEENFTHQRKENWEFKFKYDGVGAVKVFYFSSTQW